MVLGIGSYSFPWAVMKEEKYPGRMAGTLLKFAANNDIRYVQFGDNLPLHEFSPGELKELKRNADDLGVNIEVGTRGLDTANVARYLSIAAMMNSPFLRMVIDDTGYHPTFRETIDVIRGILPNLQSAGVMLAIENHDRFPCSTLEEILLQTDPHWVGVCLDTANSIGAVEGIAEVTRVLGPYAFNIHIKDFVIRRVNHKMGFVVQGTPAGSGMLGIPSLIAQVEKHGKCRTATLEVWSEDQGNIDQSVINERQWVETSIKYLKTIV